MFASYIVLLGPKLKCSAGYIYGVQTKGKKNFFRKMLSTNFPPCLIPDHVVIVKPNELTYPACFPFPRFFVNLLHYLYRPMKCSPYMSGHSFILWVISLRQMNILLDVMSSFVIFSKTACS